MKIVFLFAAVLAAVGYFAQASAAADKRPMQVDDLFKFKRVADPQISPDGTRVVYQVTSVDLDANKSSTALWVAAVDRKTPPKPLTSPAGKSDKHPRWSPDGKRILFESNRSGSSQLWVIDLDGGEARQLTEISTGANNAVWSPDGKRVAFVSAVYPEFSELPFAESDKKNKEKDEAIEKSPVKAKTFTKLFFRHWDEYVGDKRQHLFVCDFNEPFGLAVAGGPHDATPGDRDAYPTSTTFSSGEDFTFSPDSKFLVFTAVPEKDEAWSTNYDICRVAVDNKSPNWECLTKDNLAADSGPRFSPDGKKLAWRSQKKEKYEADRWNLLVADVKPDGTLAGKPANVTEKDGVDLSAGEFCWFGNDVLVFAADFQGGNVIMRAAADGEAVVPVRAGGLVSGLSAAGPLPQSLVYAESRIDHPNEVFVTDRLSKELPRNISNINDDVLGAFTRVRPESVKVPVEGKVDMQMWILKPPGFDEKKKWPVVYLVHGGPQGAWEDGWSYRWNPQLWAAQGYVVVLPNPRGSTGFGQKFTDEIAGDWGGKCYRDLVAGLDYVEKLPYVDKDRIGSAGASFGGYMQNWFAVNDIAKRFKCLISHCSVWNFESMWGTTEELWFDEYEHGGLPWEIPGKYREFSPHARAGELKKHKTPMLVIHNDLDFRCPIGQGHELFTALQRNGVPSRMVNFPDEGHWVLKPQNSRHWHKEVFAWLTKYVPPGAK
jgi:dipeptidyl aminopeptidase/acylaminoacyl peptidase